METYALLFCRFNSKVCELDIIFHFEKAYFVLDEYLFAGEVEETGYRSIMAAVDAQDMLQEVVQFLSY